MAVTATATYGMWLHAAQLSAGSQLWCISRVSTRASNILRDSGAVRQPQRDIHASRHMEATTEPQPRGRGRRCTAANKPATSPVSHSDAAEGGTRVRPT
jgi:hypothetical protein